MNPDTNTQMVEPVVVTEPVTKTPHPVHQITPVSKYLALVLFIVLPFVGAYVGYRMALEKVVEVPAVSSLPAVDSTTTPTTAFSPETNIAEVSKYKDISLTVDENGYMKAPQRDSFNDYTIAERSDYQLMAIGERIENFYIRKDDGIYLQISSSTSQIGEVMKWVTLETPLVGADADTFAVNTLWPMYARDKNHVYVNGELIPDADPLSFVPVCGSSAFGTDQLCAYSKDAKHAFWNIQMIPGADVGTFAYLFGGRNYPAFAIDVHTVYWGDGTHDGKTIKTLSNGEALKFTRPSNIEVKFSSWANFHEGYTEREFNYTEWVAFSDGETAYSLYTKDKVIGFDDASSQTFLTKVSKLGAKPVEIP